MDPCGLEDVHVTSLNREADGIVKVGTVKEAIQNNFETIFTSSLEHVTEDKLRELIN
jgi:lipoate-protein ligase B